MYDACSFKSRKLLHRFVHTATSQIDKSFSFCHGGDSKILKFEFFYFIALKIIFWIKSVKANYLQVYVRLR